MRATIDEARDDNGEATMTLRTFVLAYALMGVGYFAGMALRRAWRRRVFRASVGLDFEQVRALLPEALRARRFNRMAYGSVTDDEIEVALVYESDRRRPGNPPNVGVVFDRRSGQLLRICPDGIGLGLK